MITYMYITEAKEFYNDCQDFDDFWYFVGFLLIGLLIIPMALIIDIITSPFTLLAYLLFRRRGK